MDITNFANGDVSVVGGAGADTVTGTDLADTITSAGGADTIESGLGADVINAGANDDIIKYASQADLAGDSLVGGTGNDTLELTATGVYDLTALNATTLSDIQTLKLDNATDVTLNATQLNNLSTISGSTGIDKVTLENGATASVDLSAKSLTNVDELALGDDGYTVTLSESQIETAGQKISTITGGAGADTLAFRAGADIDISATTISAIETLKLVDDTSDQNITMNDTQLSSISTFNGSQAAGTKEITINAANGSDVNLAKTYTNIDQTTLNVASGGAGDNITGSGIKDVITVVDGANVINSGAGNDTINAGTGADTINAETGDNVINISAANLTNADTITADVSGASSLVLNADGGVSASDLSGVSNIGTIKTDDVNITELTLNDANNITTIDASSMTTVGKELIVDTSAETDVVVNVTGGANDDTFTIGLDHNVTAGNGDDTVNLTLNGAYSGTLNGGAHSGGDTLNIQNTAVDVSGATISNFESVVVTSPNVLTLSATQADNSLSVSGTGKVIVDMKEVGNQSINLAKITTANVTLLNAGAGTSTVTNLSSNLDASDFVATEILNASTADLTHNITGGADTNDTVTYSGAGGVYSGNLVDIENFSTASTLSFTATNLSDETLDFIGGGDITITAVDTATTNLNAITYSGAGDVVLTATASGAIDATTMNFAGADTLTLNGNTGNNSFTIDQTVTTVDGKAGTDSLTINAGGSASTITSIENLTVDRVLDLSGVTLDTTSLVNLDTNSNLVTLSDAQLAGETYTLSADSKVAFTKDADGSSVDYSSIVVTSGAELTMLVEAGSASTIDTASNLGDITDITLNDDIVINSKAVDSSVFAISSASAKTLTIDAQNADTVDMSAVTKDAGDTNSVLKLNVASGSSATLSDITTTTDEVAIAGTLATSTNATLNSKAINITGNGTLNIGNNDGTVDLDALSGTFSGTVNIDDNGVDTIVGSLFKDNVTLNSGGLDTVDTKEGNDTINVNENFTSIDGGSETDILNIDTAGLTITGTISNIETINVNANTDLTGATINNTPTFDVDNGVTLALTATQANSATVTGAGTLIINAGSGDVDTVNMDVANIEVKSVTGLTTLQNVKTDVTALSATQNVVVEVADSISLSGDSISVLGSTNAGATTVVKANLATGESVSTLSTDSDVDSVEFTIASSGSHSVTGTNILADLITLKTGGGTADISVSDLKVDLDASNLASGETLSASTAELNHNVLGGLDTNDTVTYSGAGGTYTGTLTSIENFSTASALSFSASNLSADTLDFIGGGDITITDVNTASTNLNAITYSGAGDVVLTATTSGAIDTTSMDFTGADTVTLNGNTGDNNFTIDQAITTVDGKAGTDSLTINAGGSVGTITEIETINVNTNTTIDTSDSQLATLNVANNVSITMSADDATGVTINKLGATGTLIVNNEGAGSLVATSIATDITLTSGVNGALAITGLEVDLDASAATGALDVTVAVDGITVTTNATTNAITATALTDGQTVILDGAGDDTVSLSAGDLAAATATGNLTVNAGSGGNVITTGTGNDTINVDADFTSINGTSGADVINIDTSGLSITGSMNNIDTIYVNENTDLSSATLGDTPAVVVTSGKTLTIDDSNIASFSSISGAGGVIVTVSGDTSADLSAITTTGTNTLEVLTSGEFLSGATPDAGFNVSVANGAIFTVTAADADIFSTITASGTGSTAITNLDATLGADLSTISSTSGSVTAAFDSTNTFIGNLGNAVVTVADNAVMTTSYTIANGKIINHDTSESGQGLVITLNASENGALLSNITTNITDFTASFTQTQTFSGDLNGVDASVADGVVLSATAATLTGETVADTGTGNIAITALNATSNADLSKLTGDVTASYDATNATSFSGNLGLAVVTIADGQTMKADFTSVTGETINKDTNGILNIQVKATDSTANLTLVGGNAERRAEFIASQTFTGTLGAVAISVLSAVSLVAGTGADLGSSAVTVDSGANFTINSDVTAMTSGVLTVNGTLNLDATDAVSHTMNGNGVLNILNLQTQTDADLTTITESSLATKTVEYASGTNTFTGDLDDFTLSISGGTMNADGAKVDGKTVDGAGTLNITGSGDGDLDLSNVDSVLTVDIDDGATTLSSLGVNMDGSASSSNLTVDIESGVTSVSTGSGADVLKIAVDDVTNALTLDANGGSDTLDITTTGALSDADFTNLSNFEAVNLTNGADSIALGVNADTALSDGAIISGNDDADTFTMDFTKIDQFNINGGTGAGSGTNNDIVVLTGTGTSVISDTPFDNIENLDITGLNTGDTLDITYSNLKAWTESGATDFTISVNNTGTAIDANNQFQQNDNSGVTTITTTGDYVFTDGINPDITLHVV